MIFFIFSESVINAIRLTSKALAVIKCCVSVGPKCVICVVSLSKTILILVQEGKMNYYFNNTVFIQMISLSYGEVAATICCRVLQENKVSVVYLYQDHFIEYMVSKQFKKCNFCLDITCRTFIFKIHSIHCSSIYFTSFLLESC